MEASRGPLLADYVQGFCEILLTAHEVAIVEEPDVGPQVGDLLLYLRDNWGEGDCEQEGG